MTAIFMSAVVLATIVASEYPRWWTIASALVLFYGLLIWFATQPQGICAICLKDHCDEDHR